MFPCLCVRLCVCWPVSGRPCASLVTLLPESRGEGVVNRHESVGTRCPVFGHVVLFFNSAPSWLSTALRKAHMEEAKTSES